MKRLAFALAALLAAAIGLTLYAGLREDAGAPATASASDEDPAVRGAYLARAGDCVACHTARGGAVYAGGRAIRTPFGTIYSPNITPDAETGIGNWSADDFWRALHNGKSKDGKLLYPAFPYPNYTHVTRADSDAMYAYFRTVTPVRQVSREPELRFPFNRRALLVAWRALYFRPGVFASDPEQTAEWNRGAYLVQGLGHCSACHTPRNILGATQTGNQLAGGMIPMLNWYAASLTGGEEGARLRHWDEQQIVDLLSTGVSQRGAVFGPMAEVVQASTQHLSNSDLRAMAVYLKSLPHDAAGAAAEAEAPQDTPQNDKLLQLGARLYDKHCADCHKASGTGAPPGYPPLAGNRSILQEPAVNPIRMVLLGGYPPSTQDNPRPYGMPPFGNTLSDEEVAAVVSFIRNNWGNRASTVPAGLVNRYRAVPLD